MHTETWLCGENTISQKYLKINLHKEKIIEINCIFSSILMMNAAFLAVRLRHCYMGWGSSAPSYILHSSPGYLSLYEGVEQPLYKYLLEGAEVDLLTVVTVLVVMIIVVVVVGLIKAKAKSPALQVDVDASLRPFR